MATTSWLDWYPGSVVTHVPFSSDHLPILITMGQPQARQRRRKPVRFEDKWTTDLECEGIIREAWGSVVSGGSPMYNLTEKIKKCRRELLMWSKQRFGGTQSQVQARWTSLEALMQDNFNDQHRIRIKG
ncbi:hypothetical protein FCV25MIE_24764 [Fagus crenata]